MPHPRVPPPPPCPAWLVEEFGAGSGRGGSALPTQPNQSKSHQAEDEQMEEKTPIPPTLSPTHQGISRFNCYDPLNGIAAKLGAGKGAGIFEFRPTISSSPHAAGCVQL